MFCSTSTSSGSGNLIPGLIFGTEMVGSEKNRDDLAVSIPRISISNPGDVFNRRLPSSLEFKADEAFRMLFLDGEGSWDSDPVNLCRRDFKRSMIADSIADSIRKEFDGEDDALLVSPAHLAFLLYRQKQGEQGLLSNVGSNIFFMRDPKRYRFWVVEVFRQTRGWCISTNHIGAPELFPVVRVIHPQYSRRHLDA